MLKFPGRKATVWGVKKHYRCCRGTDVELSIYLYVVLWIWILLLELEVDKKRIFGSPKQNHGIDHAGINRASCIGGQAQDDIEVIFPVLNQLDDEKR